MRRPYFLVLIIALVSPCAFSQTRPAPGSPPAGPEAPNAEFAPEQIIRRFAEKEAEFYEAWMQYAYTQTAVIRVLSVDGVPQKESMTIVSEVVFKDDGTREVRTVRRSGRLRSVIFTMEDQEVLDNINPFALTTKELPLYNLKYEGKERVDELDCYVFSVKPKKIRKGRLYFEGKIWVDDVDLQVVRTVGKAVPQSRENQFPEFETIRQMIDNKYWFPVWTHADSRLRFPNQVVRVEETVTYENYRKFGSRATIRYESPTAPDEDPE
jgi:outer membrane lipoprotein-sorting protein